MKYNFSRDKSDPEKSILPTIIYINTNHNSFENRRKGFILVFGLWDYSIKLAFFKK